MIATVTNMRKVEHIAGVFAYDPVTGDKFSATPGDYFWQPADEPLTGESGVELILCTRRVEIVEVPES